MPKVGRGKPKSKRGEDFAVKAKETVSKTVLVLGVGPVPPDNPRRLHAPGLRLWTLARFLARHDYKVVVAMVGFAGSDGTDPEAATQNDETLVPDHLPDEILRYKLPYDIVAASRHIGMIAARHNPRCVVSSTDFMNLAAVSARLPVPLWLDFMGQPMAERQLLADVYGSDEGLRSQWEYILPALLGGDRFSVCSERQRYMLLGELGAVGRLNRHTARENLVEVLVPFHLAEAKFTHERNVLRGICVRADDFVVLWSGGYNTWTDVDTLFAGLERAMTQHPKIVFVSIGGAIPGHDDRTFERFRRMVANSPRKNRYEFCGWVPTEDVQNYYIESNCAINIDRWSVEGQVGYRTRVLDWIMAGLPVVTTVLSELVEDLAARNFVTTFRIGDPQDLSIKLAGLAVDCAPAMEQTNKAREYLRRKLDPEKALVPLLEWVAQPKPAPDLPPPSRRPKTAVWTPENSLAHLHRATITSGSKGKRILSRLLERLP